MTGFVAADAQSTVYYRKCWLFSLAIGPLGEGRRENKEYLAFLSMECWRKKIAIFRTLKKGQLLTVRGYVRPEEWTDKDGLKHNRIVMVANEVLEPETKEETSEEQKASAKKA